MCGCSGNKNLPALPATVTLPDGSFVPLRYVGFRGGINAFPGAYGGYKFGTQQRDGKVLRDDAPRLLALREGGKPAFELVAEPEATASPPDDNPKPPSGNDGGTETPPDPVVNVPPPVQRAAVPKPATGSTSSPTKPVGKHKPGSRGK